MARPKLPCQRLLSARRCYATDRACSARREFGDDQRGNGLVAPWADSFGSNAPEEVDEHIPQQTGLGGRLRDRPQTASAADARSGSLLSFPGRPPATTANSHGSPASLRPSAESMRKPLARSSRCLKHGDSFRFIGPTTCSRAGGISVCSTEAPVQRIPTLRY